MRSKTRLGRDLGGAPRVGTGLSESQVLSTELGTGLGTSELVDIGLGTALGDVERCKRKSRLLCCC